jgi:hypothetical protein
MPVTTRDIYRTTKEKVMFVQVIQGTVADADRLKAAVDQWVRDLAPQAEGWLGTTGGVTDDNRSIALVRFESEAHAQRNSERPEQDKWWDETSRLYFEDVAFSDSVHVEADMVGDPDTAGFVQVIQGRSSNPQRARELMNQDPEVWRAFRPDILGSLSVEHADGAFTTAIYFTSESAAREGEQKDPPAEVRAAMEEMTSLSIGEPVFYDLKDPWLSGPG